ncbi:hypothetical protein ACN4EE_08315 [Geminocystis sp. CENA526]
MIFWKSSIAPPHKTSIAPLHFQRSNYTTRFSLSLRSNEAIS